MPTPVTKPLHGDLIETLEDVLEFLQGYENAYPARTRNLYRDVHRALNRLTREAKTVTRGSDTCGFHDTPKCYCNTCYSGRVVRGEE